MRGPWRSSTWSRVLARHPLVQCFRPRRGPHCGRREWSPSAPEPRRQRDAAMTMRLCAPCFRDDASVEGPCAHACARSRGFVAHPRAHVVCRLGPRVGRMSRPVSRCVRARLAGCACVARPVCALRRGGWGGDTLLDGRHARARGAACVRALLCMTRNALRCTSRAVISCDDRNALAGARRRRALPSWGSFASSGMHGWRGSHRVDVIHQH